MNVSSITQIRDAILYYGYRGLDIILLTSIWFGAEIENAEPPNREKVLTGILFSMKSEYDYI